MLLIRGELRAKHEASATEIVTPYEQRMEFQGGLLARGDMVQGAGAGLGERASSDEAPANARVRDQG